MKKLLVPTLVAAALCAFLTGCATTGSITQAEIDAAAAIVQNAADSGAIAAIHAQPANTNYFVLADAAINEFLLKSNYSATAFQAALNNIQSPLLTNEWVQLGIGGVVDLYQLYLSQYVIGQVDGNPVAAEFITAVDDGFKEALGLPLSTKGKRLVSMREQHVLLLPRPIFVPRRHLF